MGITNPLHLYFVKNIHSLMQTRIFLFMIFVLFSGSVQGQFQNVMISNFQQPNEPAIAINPKNPAEIVVGANMNNVYRSTDTGHTWQLSQLSSSYGVWAIWL